MKTIISIKQILLEGNLQTQQTQHKTIHVNNLMQKNYSYELTEPQGKNFDPRFKPELTPKQMLELGIFGGKYFNDVAKTNEYPKDWWINAKLSKTIGPGTKPNYKLNYFGVKASLPLKEWIQKGWITPEDPRGWVEWYFRYYQGRRIPKVDDLQIRRWLNAKRHLVSAITHESKTGKQSLPRLQAMLHWAYDVTKHKKGENMKTNNFTNNSNQINESIIPTKLKKLLVTIRKPFKDYGNILPPDHLKSDEYRLLDAAKSGPGRVFDYEELLKQDNRPFRNNKRDLSESSFIHMETLHEGLLDIFKKKSVLGSTNKPLVIETTPYKKKLHNTIEAKKDKIKHQIEVIDLHKKYIDKFNAKHQAEARVLQNQPKPEFKSSKIIPRDKNNPYEKYLKMEIQY